ncbi:RICIN domain-containing protein [Streptomyces sp. NRRL WC-3742]|uniref:RICIN domain-containing protein n=1 Tax=Streptomyces sp. NRRL WC-3742 TaxID=1463934 RepID=UPI0004CC2CEF|nr:RICIN domain-containing protein [Streptomyces sp. NRRL WC-3742]
MRKKALGTLAAVASAVALMLPTSASAASQSTGSTESTRALTGLSSGHITNALFGSGQCLVHFSNGQRGNSPWFYDCLNYDDQTWYFPSVGTTGPIINKYSLLYMTAQKTGYTPAFLYYNSGYPDQQWTTEDILGSGYVQFRNVNSGECLTATPGGIVQQDCIGLPGQRWELPW